MKPASSGFVMVVVLILLQLCAWLEIYALQHASKIIKQSETFWLRQIDLVLINRVLSQIENSLSVNRPACMVPVMPAETAVKKALSWWNTYGCSGNLSEIQYYYAVERLGKDPCGAIQENNMVQLSTVEYYRITLLAFPRDIKKTKLLLQSTAAFLSDEAGLCQEKFHVIKPGRQMWREI